VALLGESLSVADMSMRSVFCASLLNSASKVERKGLRDMGRLLELERVALAGDCRAGEAALLRKGLLEDRLSERPGDGWRSVIRTAISPLLFRHRRQRTVKQATVGPYLALAAPRT
jgi:hypothetical protein